VLAVLTREPLPARPGVDPELDWPLLASHEVHRRLTALTQARNTARASVRVAPRRMRLRASVELEERRVSSMYLFAGGALELVRAIGEAEEAGADDRAAAAEVQILARAVRALLAAARPWSTLGLVEPRRLAEGLLASPERADRVPVSAAARRLARDLIELLPAGG
jgi:hypothetical protein